MDETARSHFPPIRFTRLASSTLAYFDSWVWVELTKARRDDSHALAPSYEAILRAADDGQIEIVLDSTNYLELWNQSRTSSRREVARTMAALSGYRTLRAVHEVIEEEVWRTITSWRASGRFSEVEPAPRRWVVGVGARHAFASEHGRFRFVESLATAFEPEGAEVAAPAPWEAVFGLMAPEVFEWFNLVGMDSDYDVPGIDYRSTHRLGEEWVAWQDAIRARVKSSSSDASLLYRTIIADRIVLLSDQVESMTFSSREALTWFDGPTAGTAFVNSIPSQRVTAELLYSVHRQLDYDFRQHDRNDLQALAVAVPHCDVVVPDSHWAHHVRATGLADQFGTRVIQGQGQLREWAASLETPQ